MSPRSGCADFSITVDYTLSCKRSFVDMPATGSRLHATQSTLRRSCFNTLDSLATRLYRGPLRAGTRCECTATCPQRSRRRAPGTSIMSQSVTSVETIHSLSRPVPHDKTARLRRLGSTAYESLMGDHIFPTPLFSHALRFCFQGHPRR